MRKQTKWGVIAVSLCLCLLAGCGPGPAASGSEEVQSATLSPAPSSAVPAQYEGPLSVKRWDASATSLEAQYNITASFLDGAYSDARLDYREDVVEGETLIAIFPKETNTYDLMVVAAQTAAVSENTRPMRNLGFESVLLVGNALVTAVPQNTGEKILVFTDERYGGGGKVCYQLLWDENENPCFEPFEYAGEEGYTDPMLVTLYADEQMRPTVIHPNDTVVRGGSYEVRMRMDAGTNIEIYDGKTTKELDMSSVFDAYADPSVVGKGFWHISSEQASVKNGVFYLQGSASLISPPNDVYANLAFFARIDLEAAAVTQMMVSSKDYFINVARQEEDFLVTKMVGAAPNPLNARLRVEAVTAEDFSARGSVEMQPLKLEVDTEAIHIEVLQDGTLQYYTQSLLDGSDVTLSLNPFTNTAKRSPAPPQIDTTRPHHPTYMLGSWWLPIDQLPMSGRRCNFNADGTFAFSGGIEPDRTDFEYFGGTWHIQNGTLYLQISCKQVREEGQRVLYVYAPGEYEAYSQPFRWTAIQEGRLCEALFYADVPLYKGGYWSDGDQQEWLEAAMQRAPGRYEIE